VHSLLCAPTDQICQLLLLLLLDRKQHDSKAAVLEGGLATVSGAAAACITTGLGLAPLNPCHPRTHHTPSCTVQPRGLSSTPCSSTATSAIQQWLHSTCSQPTGSTGWGLLRAAKQQFRQGRTFSAAAEGATVKPPAAARAAAGPQAATAGGAAGAAAAGATPPQLSSFEKWWRNFQRVPAAAKWLGLTGAIPFIALASPVCKHLDPLLPSVVSENCAMVQVRGGRSSTLLARTYARMHAGQQLQQQMSVHVVLLCLRSCPGSSAWLLCAPACVQHTAQHTLQVCPSHTSTPLLLSPTRLLPLPHRPHFPSHPMHTQMCYGVVIVTFLGAVHWGLAMATPLTSPVAYRLASEAYVWSVIPSLLAWPVALMDPGEEGGALLMQEGTCCLWVDCVLARCS
jgi:hypothetical protein